MAESYLDISEVRRRLGRNDKSLNPSTVWRWMRNGIGKKKVKLWHLRVGGRYVTTEAALDAFLAELNPSQGPAPAIRTATARGRAARRAEQELSQMGV